MSNLVDFDNLVLQGDLILPQAITSNTNTSAVDLKNATIRTAARLVTGAVVANSAFTCKIQESDSTTANTFVDIPGALFSNTLISTANTFDTIQFNRSKRYVRAVTTITGANASVTCSLIVLGQLKYGAAYGTTAAGFDRSPST